MSAKPAAQKADAMKTTATAKQAPVKESRPRVLRRYISRREAVEAADRFFTINGKRYVVRFSLGQRVEHYILLISFTLLGITGLAQTYATTTIGYFILNLFGGIDSTRVVHHSSAFIFGILSIYHVSLFLYRFFMGHHIPKIMPEWSDLLHLIQMIKLDLGLSKNHPRFDRYNFEEKVEYWALVWGTIVMGLTGIMQWFPVATTYYLPGGAIPVARTFHKWEAILAVLAILIWHSYHSVIKKRNTSIFSGLMSIEDMEEEHPQELAFLRAAAAAVNNRSWPTLIEIPLEDEHDPEPPAPAVEVAQPAAETAAPEAPQETDSSTPVEPGDEGNAKPESSGDTE
jgi:cytochrome b subunit of formate dehydrogenase